MTQIIHSAVKPLEWLIGKWTGKNGLGIVQGKSSFNYDEEIEISHPAPHQPVLHLKFVSWLHKPNDQKIMAHCEYAFLKIIPNTNPPKVVYSSTQNTSLVTIEEGVYEDNSKSITIESKSIGRSAFNKPPEVTSTKRLLQLSDGKLISKFYMGTTTYDLQEHLFISYSKS